MNATNSYPIRHQNQTYHVYTLCSRCEQDTSPDVETDMLKVFCIDVYDLLDLGAKFSFVTPLKV